MKIGISLLFVKPQKSGGIESYIRNLLDGLMKYGERDLEIYLFTSYNNDSTFNKYKKDIRFKFIKCPIDSNKVVKRILWENIKLDKIARLCKLDLMFIPVYNKPFITKSKIPYVTVIHDLQALHYPEYFSKLKCLWLKFAWKKSAVTSDKIIAISQFVKNDIIENLKIDGEKIDVIYNPITKLTNIEKFKNLQERFGIEKNKYFYTVSSMLEHKNLKTLLYLMKSIKDQNLNICNKLVISGVGGSSKESLVNIINQLNIRDNVIMTGYVSDRERDCLYKNANAFLFPSIFEGFGMPPIEAMMNGTKVITTEKSSLKEVTKNKAIYVKKPFDVEEWISCIYKLESTCLKDCDFEEYGLETITNKYIDTFKLVLSKSKGV